MLHCMCREIGVHQLRSLLVLCFTWQPMSNIRHVRSPVVHQVLDCKLCLSDPQLPASMKMPSLVRTESREARIPSCIDHGEDLLNAVFLAELVTQAQRGCRCRLAFRVPLKSVVSAARLLAASSHMALGHDCTN